MTGGIYLIRDNGKLVEMSQQEYDSEELLQRLLADYPSLLAGDQIDPSSPRRWLLVSREAAVPDELGGVGRWSLDHLFLYQDGIPTLVEVKRSSDARIRREVVGQMLDYAANGVAYWPVDSIRSLFISRWEKRGADAATVLAEFLGPEGNPDQFWAQVKTNLQAGRIRMVFVADEIPQELRRVVEFLNEQMDPAEVLAVQVRQFAGEGLRTLVPQVYGQTAEAQERKGATRAIGRRWDEASLLADLARRKGPEALEAARGIIAWAHERRLTEWWGSGSRDGSFVPGIEVGGKGCWPICIYSYGRLEVQFQHLKPRRPFNDTTRRLEFARRLSAVPGIAIPDDAIDRRPSIDLTALADPTTRAEFLAVVEWVFEEHRAAWQDQRQEPATDLVSV